jgi:hypothetical protein
MLATGLPRIRRISRLLGASTLAVKVTLGNRRPARMPRCRQQRILATVLS